MCGALVPHSLQPVVELLCLPDARRVCRRRVGACIAFGFLNRFEEVPGNDLAVNVEIAHLTGGTADLLELAQPLVRRIGLLCRSLAPAIPSQQRLDEGLDPPAARPDPVHCFFLRILKASRHHGIQFFGKMPKVLDGADVLNSFIAADHRFHSLPVLNLLLVIQMRSVCD